MRRHLPAAILLAGLLGCSVPVESTRLGPTYAPVSPDTDVRLFSVRVPECPFEEIALVSAYADPLSFQSKADALEALEQRVRKLGGNGIVGLTDADQRGETPIRGVRGTAIRFTDAACQH